MKETRTEDINCGMKRAKRRKKLFYCIEDKSTCSQAEKNIIFAHTYTHNLFFVDKTRESKFKIYSFDCNMTMTLMCIFDEKVINSMGSKIFRHNNYKMCVCMLIKY
jgi:hypothetical protein